MSTLDCRLCSNIQEAVAAEWQAAEFLLEAADTVGFHVLPPGPGEGVPEEDWLEYATRRDEYDRARTHRVRSDNRFFDSCPRCHFDLRSSRRQLELLRNELPWYRDLAICGGRRPPQSPQGLVLPEPRVRATGS